MRLHCMEYFPHVFIFSSQWSVRQVILLFSFTDGKRRLREVRQLAPHDREGMRCLPGTRADSATLCCLPQRGNVICGYSDQLSQCAQVWKGSQEAGLPGLKAGLSQTNWDKLVTLGMCGLTLSNLLSCLFKRFFRKTGTGAVALSLWGELANWSSKGNPMSCL